MARRSHPRPRGFTLVELLVVMAVLSLLAALLLPALSRVREMGRRARCGKSVGQILISQQNYCAGQTQRGQPEAFIRGSERFCNPSPPPGASAVTDGSRAMLYLAKAGFFEQLAGYACPSDPFVAVLDGAGPSIPADLYDFPAENVALGAGPLASPSSPAAQEDGHSFFSYGLQSGSPNRLIGLGPNMHARVPAAGERNPWDFILTNVIAGDEHPDVYSPASNSWNHNRGGNSVAFADGHVVFQEDARAMEMPLSAAPGAAMGYDYLYDPTGPDATKNARKIIGFPSMSAGNSVGWSIWISD